jgi:hypothetical protein
VGQRFGLSAVYLGTTERGKAIINAESSGRLMLKVFATADTAEYGWSRN